ncbi:MAG: ABC transporter ATP-binding protein [Deltaproteobacteria bacterium]
MSLEFRELSKQVYGEVHIAQTDLSLNPGVFNILLGPTLSGKTSLMRLMAGLDQPSTGSVWFKGQNVTGIPVQRRNLAMVYQQFINFPNMSVFENIASPLRIQKLSESQLRPRVEKVADLLKLTPYMQRKPSELSGGQQQRTALARALVKGADLVLLDEPLVNLDYKLREELREELPQLFADTGATVVYATTEPHEALLMGGYTATMREGQVTQYGPTHEVFRKPHDLATAKAFSDPPLNTLSLKRTTNGFEGEQGLSLQLPPFQNVPVGEYTLGFRPHHLQIQSNGNDILNLSGEVTVTEITGSESFIHLRWAEHDWVAHTQGVMHFAPGENLDLFVSASNCLLFDDQEQLVPAQV